MPDNRMCDISWQSARPFPVLTVLDLSFNQLSSDAVSQLAALERLRELDLTCNGLTRLPENMCAFVNLELLMLNNNQIGDSESLRWVSEAPKLRELDLSRNKVATIPHDVDFAALEWLSLVGNFIESHEDVAPLSQAPELVQVLLYNNPITTTGRKTQSCGKNLSEELHSVNRFSFGGASSRLETREVINVVTDAPSKEAPRVPKMRGLYSGFKVTKVAELRMLNPREWKERGRQLLEDREFTPESQVDENEGKMMDEDAERNQDTSSESDDELSDTKRISTIEKEEKILTEEEEGKYQEEEKRSPAKPNSVFLTEPTLLESGPQTTFTDIHREKPIDDEALCEELHGRTVSEEYQKPLDALNFTMGTTTSQLRAQLALFRPIHESRANFQQRKNPAAVATATSALRFALQHPLTSHTSDLGTEPEDEAMLKLTRQTSSSRLKVKSSAVKRLSNTATSRNKMLLQNSGTKSGIRPKPNREDKRLMESIEAVLNRMDFNNATAEQIRLLDQESTDLDESEQAVHGLMTMVDQVMRDFS